MLNLINLTLGELVAQARERLIASGVANADQESRWLVQDALEITSAEILAWSGRLVSDMSSTNMSAGPDKISKLENWLTRREDGEPLQYILGSANFYGRDFFVTSDVLIPRPDTELLIDAALSVLSPSLSPSCSACCDANKSDASESAICNLQFSHTKCAAFLDWGTGSGCIAITLLLERPDLFAIMADASPAALSVASKNLERYGLRDRAQLLLTKNPGDIKASLTHNLTRIGASLCDLVISNPPYIPSGELATLQREVQREPRMALDGGIDGMDFYKSLLTYAPDWLTPGGYLVFELGDANQADALKFFAPDRFEFKKFFMSDFNSDLENIRCGIWRYRG